MEYKRLPYYQYFIDTSEDFNKTNKVRNKVDYIAVPYQCYFWEKIFHMQHEVNYAFVYDQKRNVIQIYFQKTNGWSDWFVNIVESASKYYDSFEFEGEQLELHVHRGWGAMYKTIKHVIRDKWLYYHNLYPDAATEIMGWSLGSGQAMLCCQDLNWNYGVKPYVYTFGSVKPFRSHHGNAGLLDRYLSSISSRTCNFANRNDLVTYMPPFKGFRMISRRNLGREQIRLSRLLDPYKYHTIYDHRDLYMRKK